MEILVKDEIKKAIAEGTRYRSGIDPDEFYKRYDVREKFRIGVSWHIPTDIIVNTLIKYGPIVSIGSGFAYTESMVKEKGGDIIPTDIEPSEFNKWCRNGNFYCEVEKLEAKNAVKKYKKRNVFMAWPPYDTPMAYEVVLEMEVGRDLIYIGEGYGGCNGDDDFFKYLTENFEELDDITIPRWDGIYDICRIYKKIK
jgi:hypothetical protein